MLVECLRGRHENKLPARHSLQGRAAGSLQMPAQGEPLLWEPRPGRALPSD